MDEKNIIQDAIYDYGIGLGTVGDVVQIKHPEVKLPDGVIQKSTMKVIIIMISVKLYAMLVERVVILFLNILIQDQHMDI